MTTHEHAALLSALDDLRMASDKVQAMLRAYGDLRPPWSLVSLGQDLESSIQRFGNAVNTLKGAVEVPSETVNLPLVEARCLVAKLAGEWCCHRLVFGDHLTDAETLRYCADLAEEKRCITCMRLAKRLPSLEREQILGLAGA